MFCIFHMRVLVAVHKDERKKIRGSENRMTDRWIEFCMIASENVQLIFCFEGHRAEYH